jgi:hypothetical protein
MQEKTKQECVLEYINSIALLDEIIKPYRDQKTELRKSFVHNGWLTSEEIKIAMKAYRLVKDKTSIEELTEMFDMLPKDEE